MAQAARRQAEDLHVGLGEFIQTAVRERLNQVHQVAVTHEAQPPFAPPRIRSGLKAPAGPTLESVVSTADETDDAATLTRLERP